MKIQPGIHENVILSKVMINDKGRLTLTWRDIVEQAQEEEDPLAAGNAAEVIEKDSGSSLILWPFKTPDEKTRQGEIRTSKERGELANGDIMQLKNQLQQILEQYTTKDQIKWSIFESAAITKETYWDDIWSQSNLDVIYRNIAEQFIAQISPFLDNNAYPVRLKLVRQSKDKHYARVPGMFIKDNPFIEPMSVPKEQSRVKFTPYELKEKLDDPTPVTRETADHTEEPEEGENAFGSR